MNLPSCNYKTRKLEATKAHQSATQLQLTNLEKASRIYIPSIQALPPRNKFWLRLKRVCLTQDC